MQFRSAFVNSQRYLRIFDWVLGVASLGWGLYAQSPWWIAGGVLGLALAWYDPGSRLRKHFAIIKQRPAKSG